MLNPIHLQTLLACVRTGSFAEAGRELGYTPSAVSQQMSLLERSIGANLFERSAQSVRISSLAIEVAERSRSVLKSIDALEHEIEALTSGTAGQLRIASTALAKTQIVPMVLDLILNHDKPDALIELGESTPDELLDDVQRGHVDVGLVFEYGDDPRVWPQDLTAEVLFTEPLHLITSRARVRAPANELLSYAEDHWICTRTGTAGSRVLDRFAASAGFTPRVMFRSNDYSIIQELVERDLGIALMPVLAFQDADVAHIPIAGVGAGRSLLALYRAQNANPLLPDVLCKLRTTSQQFIQAWQERAPTSEHPPERAVTGPGHADSQP